MGIFAQIKFYIGPVPYTMQNFALVSAGLILEPKYALMSQLIYLSLIAVGMPLGAGFRGGPTVLFGYTAGYLWAFPISCTLMSYLSKLYLKKSLFLSSHTSGRHVVILLLISLVAIIPVYLLGFIVFFYYAIQPTALGIVLRSWSRKLVDSLGFSTMNETLILFTASVLIFIPQDLLVDHLLAVLVATRVLRHLNYLK